jgi:tetratricopeptide (TPR) repeat protein
VLRVDAMEHYVRGLLARDAGTKLRLFTLAAKLDARYSQPCFQLGRLFWQKKDYKTAAQWFERVSPVDSHFREATFLRGLCKYYSGDYAGAQAAFEMVVKEVPLNEVQNNLGAAQLRRNLPEAEENFRRAVEGDPGDPVYHFNLGYALWKKGAFEEAAKSFRAALEREPGDAAATLMLGRCLQKSGPRAGDARTEGLERLKHDYEEAAWWQLRALMSAGRK